MRPYLAVIKDSFREAFASRVLWLLLLLIGCLLLIVAPLGYQMNLTGELTWGDIVEGPELVTKIRRAAATGQPSPGGRIWSQFSEETQQKLTRLARIEEGDNQGFRSGMDALREALNKQIAMREFYDADSWKGVSLPTEAKDYLARPRSELTKEELARLNRLLIEAAFRSHFRPRPAHSISITFFWLASDPLPFSKQQVDAFIKEWVLTTAMSWIVGVLGMITAILVTSTIVPQMFDPGSITLLLSKPVSRSLLFVTKFLGACAFILLNVSLLLVGLWLIAGVRFGIWNRGILWCIPIFLFMFLVYYAVSAVTGLIWKSAVISVVLTVVFWALCFGVDLAHTVVNDAFLDQRRITRMVEAEGDLLVFNEGWQMQVWDEKLSTWRIVEEPPRGPGIPTIDGPFFHARTKQLLVGQGMTMPFGLGSERTSLKLGKAAEGWTLRDGPALPSGTATSVLMHDGTLLAIAPDNVFRLQGDPALASSQVKVFGMTLPFGGGGSFRPTLADTSLNFKQPLTAASDPQLPRIVVASGNEVYLLTKQEGGKFDVTAKRTLVGDEADGSAVAVAGSSVLVAREDGKIWLLAAADLAIEREYTLEYETQPRFVAAAPDGQFAVLFQNRHLWLIGSEQEKRAARRAPVAGQGEISGIALLGDRLLVADYANRVIAYRWPDLARDKVYYPELSRMELIYYYLVRPLHTVSPKPRMLDRLVQYVLTGKRTTDLGVFGGDLAQKRDDLHPWRPVTSGLAFVAVMLLIACVYIERQEF